MRNDTRRLGILAASLVALAAHAAQATVAPRHGGPLPVAARRLLAADPGAYRVTRAWTGVVRRARAAREAARRAGTLASAPRFTVAVAGTLRVPVLAGYFAGETAPGPVSTWQDQLFGLNPTGNVTDYWNEVSYGALTLTGNVYGWTAVSQAESFYAGLNNGLDPSTDHVGEFIRELLAANDAAIDFGQFDNDGPDGIPNSGDDDGFVDMIAFVHSHVGGECGGNAHIWSHRWVYSAWNASGLQPYTTDDPAAGGGFIRINDYTIQPAFNCTGPPDVIDIGVFCHEFGHAMGLPDLYDVNGGGEGIGHWGIMGSGNWNTPAQPAHPCAWTRAFLGWVVPTDVDWTGATYAVDAIETTPVAFRLRFTSERFRRSAACPIAGVYSLWCGLDAGEGTTLGWAAPGTGGGYGSAWDESIRRDFTVVDPADVPVTLTYAYRVDTEAGFDFATLSVVTAAGETVLRTYSGVASGVESVDLTSTLASLGAGDPYAVVFRVHSSRSFADDDGVYDSNCGAFAVVDVHVTGGGIDDLSDFETTVDGWYPDPADNPDTEYWLVENRQPTGFDANLHGSGLLIWHVDDDVLEAYGQGNSAGENGTLVRGLVLEEADGLFNLNTGTTNRGEPGDPWPGSLGRTLFDATTTPSSNDNLGRATRIAVGPIPPSAPQMMVPMRAGDPPPVASAVAPGVVDNDLTSVLLSIDGARLRHGATFRLVYSGGVTGPQSADIVPSLVRWVDPARVEGVISPFSRAGGAWHLVVTNPDGQVDTLVSALTINTIVPTRLQDAAVGYDAQARVVRLRYALAEHEPGDVLRVLRAGADGVARAIVDPVPLDGAGAWSGVDRDVRPGELYTYRLVVADAGGVERELHRAEVRVPVERIVLEGAVPNPFNPETTIRFALPRATRVDLAVYDVAGRRVATLASGRFAAGRHAVRFSGTSDAGTRLGSGVYFYRLAADGRVLTRRMVLVK